MCNYKYVTDGQLTVMYNGLRLAATRFKPNLACLQAPMPHKALQGRYLARAHLPYVAVRLNIADCLNLKINNNRSKNPWFLVPEPGVVA
jgi:hypothetical protein